MFLEECQNIGRDQMNSFLNVGLVKSVFVCVFVCALCAGWGWGGGGGSRGAGCIL